MVPATLSDSRQNAAGGLHLGVPEHSVVNMFIIPTGMMMGAKVTVADWWLWNQIPVTLGNVVGGFCFTGFAIYWTYKPAAGPAVQPAHAAATAPAE